jgi:hypothetical protein
MSKKKWQEQATAYHQKIVDLLKLHEDVSNIGQDSYKSDFFKIFADAYQSNFCTPDYRKDESTGRLVPRESQRPLITGDTIWAYAKDQGWVHAEMTGDEKRYRDIERVQTWWDEWVYAWNHRYLAPK